MYTFARINGGTFMKKALLVVAAAVAAGGIYYLSRTTSSPANEDVQGAIGGRRLVRGSTVCVNRIQNLSGKELAMEGIHEDLAAQLNRAGFKASVGANGDCEGTVYGEIIGLKGKDRVEAEVEFRLLIAGDQTPYLSSIAKGKSGANASVPAKDVIMALQPGKLPATKPAADHSAASREAVTAAFADLAKQVEAQLPSRSTRAAAQ
jgi:hypothetical protein